MITNENRDVFAVRGLSATTTSRSASPDAGSR
jgi:hypothetical protein